MCFTGSSDVLARCHVVMKLLQVVGVHVSLPAFCSSLLCEFVSDTAKATSPAVPYILHTFFFLFGSFSGASMASRLSMEARGHMKSESQTLYMEEEAFMLL